MLKPDAVSRSLHGKLAAVAMFVIAAVYILASGHINTPLPPQLAQGLGLPSPTEWALSPLASTVVSVCFNLLTMLLILFINKTYNLLRTVTWLPIGLFAIMQGAIPQQVISLNSGSLVGLVIITCLFMMFDTYDNHSSTRTIFSTFLLLALAATTQYCFAIFIPLFWVICVQMRVLTLRGFIASALGILTVWINLPAFGIVDINNIQVPDIDSIFTAADGHTALYLMTVCGITTLMFIVSVTANALKTLAYNARSRALNGALLLVSLLAILAIIFDYNNCFAYVALLNFSAAYQITHYFVNHRYERQYIAVLGIIGVYIALYFWRLSL